MFLRNKAHATSCPVSKAARGVPIQPASFQPVQCEPSKAPIRQVMAKVRAKNTTFFYALLLHSVLRVRRSNGV